VEKIADGKIATSKNKIATEEQMPYDSVWTR